MRDRKTPIDCLDELMAEDAIPCPHCGKGNDEDDWWNGDSQDLIGRILSEDSHYDLDFECLHCGKPFKFHAYSIRHYWVKKDQ